MGLNEAGMGGREEDGLMGGWRGGEVISWSNEEWLDGFFSCLKISKETPICGYF